MESLLPLLKEFGFPVALCVVLLLAIRQQNGQLVKAFTDRIKTLERVVQEQGETIELHRHEINKLQAEMLRRADEYGHTIKDVASRYAAVIRDHNAWNQKMMDVLARLVDSIQIRPCMMDGYAPHPHHPSKVPSSSEIPAPPIHEAPTDRLPARQHA
jgi:hypothetical protein